MKAFLNISCSILFFLWLFIPFSSCNFDNRQNLFQSKEAYYKILQARQDSLTRKYWENKVRIKTHPFNIESGEINYTAQKKISGIYYPQQEMIFSFENYGKVRMLEIKSSDYDLKADKRVNMYTRYFTRDSIYYEIKNHKKTVRASKGDAWYFNFVCDTCSIELKRTNRIDNFKGTEATRYKSLDSSYFYSVWNGIVLYFEGKARDGEWKIIPEKIKTKIKIPAKKFEIPKDYKKVGF